MVDCASQWFVDFCSFSLKHLLKESMVSYLETLVKLWRLEEDVVFEWGWLMIIAVISCEMRIMLELRHSTKCWLNSATLGLSLRKSSNWAVQGLLSANLCDSSWLRLGNSCSHGSSGSALSCLDSSLNLLLLLSKGCFHMSSYQLFDLKILSTLVVGWSHRVGLRGSSGVRASHHSIQVRHCLSSWRALPSGGTVIWILHSLSLISHMLIVLLNH